MTSKGAALVAALMLAACGHQPTPPPPPPPPPPVPPPAAVAADFLATKQCPDGSLPGFAGTNLAQPCANPAPLTPTTSIAWMLQGNLWHSGDPNAYPSRTVGIADAGGAFYDLSQTNWPSGCPVWAAAANPSCQDGAMDVIYVQSFPDLGGQTAHGFATLWGLPWIQYFNGVQCQARPVGAAARYLVFDAAVAENTWSILPEWWPNNTTTEAPDCTADGTGRIAVVTVWRGLITLNLTIAGATQPVQVEASVSQMYWNPRPQPGELETLTFGKDLAILRYQLWCDSSNADCAAADVGSGCPDYIAVADGSNVSQPHLPTGTAGVWRPQICTDFNTIVPAAPGMTGQQFFSQVPGFPGVPPGPLGGP